MSFCLYAWKIYKNFFFAIAWQLFANAHLKFLKDHSTIMLIIVVLKFCPLIHCWSYYTAIGYQL